MHRALFRTVSLLVPTLLLLVFAVLAPGSRSAFAATCGSVDLRYDAAWTPTGTDNAGAEAYIYEYDPRICTGETDAASGVWAMMNNSTNSSELAQVGWVKWGAWSTSTVYAFYEYGYSTELEPPIQIYPMNSSSEYGTVDSYAVFTNGSAVTEFLINDIEEADESLSWNWTANQDQWFGETHYPQDQTPGDLDHPVEFYNIASLHAGVWQNQNTAAEEKNTSPYGSGSWPTGNAFEIWDTRYSTEG